MNSNRRAVFVAESLPRIESLALDGKFLAAFELAREVERQSGVVSSEAWTRLANRVSVDSRPSGATVTIRPFGSAGEVIALGVTPLTDTRVPRGPFHWRVEAPGHLPADYVSATPGESLSFDLRPSDALDPDMVLVPASEMQLWVLGNVKPVPSVSLGPFQIDRHEVTNREFTSFVAAGGYTREEFWKHPFERQRQPQSLGQ